MTIKTLLHSVSILKSRLDPKMSKWGQSIPDNYYPKHFQDSFQNRIPKIKFEPPSPLPMKMRWNIQHETFREQNSDLEFEK